MNCILDTVQMLIIAVSLCILDTVSKILPTLHVALSLMYCARPCHDLQPLQYSVIHLQNKPSNQIFTIDGYCEIYRFRRAGRRTRLPCVDSSSFRGRSGVARATLPTATTTSATTRSRTSAAGTCCECAATIFIMGKKARSIDSKWRKEKRKEARMKTIKVGWANNIQVLLLLLLLEFE